MTQADAVPEMAPKKSKLPLLIGLLGAIALGGGGFYATFTGLILGTKGDTAAAMPEGLPDIGFVAVDPIVISLGPSSMARHLRFACQLEVGTPHVDEIRLLLPRIVDVLNSYLRAVEITQLEDPAALVRLKAQMLRRIQIVTGEGRVTDLLISEFILN